MLAIERHRYNSLDLNSQIDFDLVKIKDCKLQGLLYAGNLILLMTRVCRVSNSNCNVLRYGFSQLRTERDLDIIALSIRGLFDEYILKSVSVILSLQKECIGLRDEVVFYMGEKKDRDKRRRKNERRLKKRRDKQQQYYGCSESCNDGEIG